MKNDKFLLDLPEKQNNDAIGYDIYINNIIAAIKSDARMIGLISNYGSGKSTVVNMVGEKIGQDESENNIIKIIPINLWKIKAEERENNMNAEPNDEDKTLDIHKFLLRSLIQYLPESSNKDYFRRKIDNKYMVFNIAMKNKSSRYAIYILLVIFFFNIILKLDIVGFDVPQIFNYMLDLLICAIFVFILSKSKIYFSFNKETSNRTINESDTSDCFNEIINEMISSEKYDNIIICIEDLDRYNDSKTVIRVIEQIYKFYIEKEEQKRVKFIISLKPPYTLVKDSISSIKKNGDNNKELVKEYKELYEKLFDVIINLQTISFQNYGSVLIKLLEQKKDLLKQIELEIPKMEEDIGIWNYLYKGKNVTVRDIKHRYNYFLVIYENLYNHKKTLKKDNLIQINVETCLFIAYLEDEYSNDFYHLLEDSQKFNNIVTSYIFNKEMIIEIEDYSEGFITELKEALNKGIITIDYSMYFYKYPKDKPILNIFDSTIQNAICSDSLKNIYNFELYCAKANQNIIIESLKRKVKESGMPEIIFANKILFHEANKLYHKEILSLLSQKYVFSSEKGLKTVRRRLIQIRDLNKMGEEKILDDYINIIAKDLEENYMADKVVEYRQEIIDTIGLLPELSPLYSENLPLITMREITLEMSPSTILHLINTNLIQDDSIIEIIELIAKKDIPFKELISFFDKISSIDKNIFKKIFYSFDYSKYSKTNKYIIYKKNYSSLELNNLEQLKRLVEKTKILPNKTEKYIIHELKNMSAEDIEKNEQLYIDMINIVKTISSVFIKYISNCNIFYIYNEKVENKLYEKHLYKQYVYSKYNRLKRLIYEPSKFDDLKESLLYYFMNSKNLNESYVFDKEILTYIKQNSDYMDLPFSKIMLLLKLPQTYEDFLCIYKKNYKEAVDGISELSQYLNNVECFDKDSENKIIMYLINVVKNKEVSLSINTYNHIMKTINNISNKRKFQKVKRMCTN